jgi:hypothetical protein
MYLTLEVGNEDEYRESHLVYLGGCRSPPSGSHLDRYDPMPKNKLFSKAKERNTIRQKRYNNSMDITLVSE